MALIANAMSCDLEEYFQVQACEGVVARDQWAAQPSRLEPSTERVLALLDEAEAKATFFVLGWNAARHPELVRRIAAAGHEVASHGYGHRMITEQTPEEFRDDVRRAKALLEDLAGQPVVGFRAPTFSITERTRWALAILAEEGYRYDSSIFPIRHDRYGIPSAPRFLYEVGQQGASPAPGRSSAPIGRIGPTGPTEDGGPRVQAARPTDGRSLVEFPPTTLQVLGCNLPVAGGGYLRLLPVRLVAAALRRVNRQGHPAIVYFHPWELDSEQPRLPLRGLSRFRHYVGLARTADKLRHLLRAFAFTTARAVVETWRAARREPAPRAKAPGPGVPGLAIGEDVASPFPPAPGGAHPPKPDEAGGNAVVRL